MDGAVESAGALATAAAVAAVIDPPAARAGAGGTCLNCGAALAGDYCSECGQKAHIHRSLVHAAEELVHGVWHFDSKLWRTLPMLAAQPGRLTRDYVMGRRARYISPFALFLLTIFLMFFVFGFSGAVRLPTDVEIKAAGAAASTPAGKARLAELDRSLGEIDRDLAAARKDPARADEIAALEAMRSGLVASRRVLTAAAEGKLESPEGPAWASALKSAAAENEASIDIGNESLNMKVHRALRNPELALYKVQQKGYKLSFLLLPMSLPWMLLLFAWKRDVRAYDHVVFLLYSISFMSLLVISVALLAMVGLASEWLVSLLILVVPVHMFAQLKGAYALSTASALWRAVMLLFLSMVTLALYFALIVTLGVVD